MADKKAESTEVAEEVCTKDKPAEQKKVEDDKAVEAEKEEEDTTDEKTENGDAKEENGKEAEAEEEEEEVKEDNKKKGAEVTVCKRKSNAGDAANGVETTPEKKQKLDEVELDDKETKVAA